MEHPAAPGADGHRDGGILFAAVRRTFGPAAAIIAGLVIALTPAAVLIFRYNNPDALLTLLLVAAACALIRALESGRLRWVALAGILVGSASRPSTSRPTSCCPRSP